jgi:hypothetical protein
MKEIDKERQRLIGELTTYSDYDEYLANNFVKRCEQNAQKEFLDFLHDLRLKNVFEDKYETEKICLNKIEELKKEVEK